MVAGAIALSRQAYGRGERAANIRRDIAGVTALTDELRKLHYRTTWTQAWEDAPWAAGRHRWEGCAQCGGVRAHAQWPCETIRLLDLAESLAERAA